MPEDPAAASLGSITPLLAYLVASGGQARAHCLHRRWSGCHDLRANEDGTAVLTAMSAHTGRTRTAAPGTGSAGRLSSGRPTRHAHKRRQLAAPHAACPARPGAGLGPPGPGRHQQRAAQRSRRSAATGYTPPQSVSSRHRRGRPFTPADQRLASSSEQLV